MIRKLLGVLLLSLPLAALSAETLYPDVSRAQADLDAALKTAAQSNKRVIVDFGGNWCGDCKVLDINLRKPENAALLQKHYVLVHVNVGEKGIDQNLDLGQRYRPLSGWPQEARYRCPQPTRHTLDLNL